MPSQPRPSRGQVAFGLNSRVGALLLGCLLAVTAGASAAAVSRVDPVARDAPCLDTREVLALFLAAVDRGELSLFGVTLRRDQVTPARIELVLDLRTRTTARKVYVEIDEPLPVPGHPDYAIEGITATLTGENRIGETEAHLSPD